MKKQIKLSFVNYEDTIEVLGESQKEFHQTAFNRLLVSVLNNNFAQTKMVLQHGVLYLHEVEDTEEHKIFKYIFQGV